MRRVLIVTLVLLFAAGIAVGQDSGTDAQPRGAVSFILAGSFAPFGAGAEVFLGPLGLGGTLTMLPFGTAGNFVLLYEPGVYGRLYFSDPESAMYASASTSYLSVAGASAGDLGTLEAGILRLNGALGYNAFLGRDNSTRFAFELGPRYNAPVVSGASQDTGWIFVHFMLMFGQTF